ncbi:hypothetical protein [Brachyspira intermedia]|uniref:hypothetical protein n=1 Tax=Brachyspira intermedia TaxID=84377 RepID=UPI0030059E6B
MKKIILLGLIFVNILYAEPDGYYQKIPFYEMDRIKPLIDNIYYIRGGIKNARENNFSEFFFKIIHDYEEDLTIEKLNECNKYLISITEEAFEYDYIIENIYIDHDLMMVKLINSH